MVVSDRAGVQSVISVRMADMRLVMAASEFGFLKDNLDVLACQVNEGRRFDA